MFGMLKSGNSLLKVCTVRVRGASVLVLADGLSDSCLSKGGRKRDLVCIRAIAYESSMSGTYGCNDGASDGIMGRSSMDSKCSEPVDRRGRARRRFNSLSGHVVES